MPDNSCMEKNKTSLSQKANRELRPVSSCMVVLGTRPEAIKLFPVIQQLRASHVKPFVVNTGQHADMVKPVLDMAGIAPDVDLGIGRPGQTINSLVRDIVAAIDNLFDELRGGPERRSSPRLFGGTGTESPYPAAMIVHGDTTTALAGALAAAGAKVPVLHVEAGLRTGDIHSPFPEELNRKLIGGIAAFHFAPVPTNQQNLVREGIDEQRIFVTGNTGLDALKFAASLSAPYRDDRLNILDKHTGPVIVATAHRRENWGRGLANIAWALHDIAASRPDTLTVVPMHPNAKVREQLLPILGNLDNVILTEPLEYAEFARLLARATLAISDSGGIQEEAPSLGTPVLVTRNTSERMEGVYAGTLQLVGTNTEEIINAAATLLDDPLVYRRMANAPNPFGDGKASRRIVAALEHLIFNMPAPAPFGAGFDRRKVLEAAGYSAAEVERSLEWAEQLTKNG